MKKMIIAFVAVAVIAVGSLVAYNLANKSVNMTDTAHKREKQHATPANPDSHSTMAAVIPTRELADAKDVTPDDFETKMVEKLKTGYQDKIADLSVQASLIKVKQYVLDQFPEDGNALFHRIIMAAFPQHADSIFRVIGGLEEYQDWMTDQYLYLQELSPLARNGALWQKRKEIFGNDAQLIWQEEKNRLAQGKLQMQEVLHQLDQSQDMSMDEKLFQLRSAIHDNLRGNIQDAAINEGVISRAFFNLSSVQESLASLPEEERQMQIDNIRRQSGYSEEQIERLSTRDKEREARWQNGANYMKEREQLVERLDGEQLEEALQDLRKQYFKHEAATIQKEEEMDFWRFKRPRKFGNN